MEILLLCAHISTNLLAISINIMSITLELQYVIYKKISKYQKDKQKHRITQNAKMNPQDA